MFSVGDKVRLAQPHVADELCSRTGRIIKIEPRYSDDPFPVTVCFPEIPYFIKEVVVQVADHELRPASATPSDSTGLVTL